MKALLVRAAAVALAVAGATGTARASWVPGASGTADFSGSTEFVGYAVWKNTTGATTLTAEINAALGLSGSSAYPTNPISGGSNAPATNYLYFYEAINYGSNATVSSLTLPVAAANVQAAGSLPVTSSPANEFNEFQNSSTPTFRTNGTYGTVGTVWAAGGVAGGEEFSGANLGHNNFTTLMIIGSSVGPEFKTSTLGTSGGSATASLPVPTPEPGTLALMGLAVPVLGWGYARRLRQNRALAAVAQ
jgi:hypothetical protein